MAETALIISATSPVPVDSGKRLFQHGLLDYFVHRLGPANVHYALLDDATNARRFRGSPTGSTARAR